MILVVDDQKDAATALKRLLILGGHPTRSANAGSEALAMMHMEKPSLVILDMNMPLMDGLTLLRIMKSDRDLKDICVAMYSADTSDETRDEASRLGAEDYVGKCELSYNDLLTRFGELADRCSSEEQLMIQAAASSVGG